jgi:hypothetical protein
MGPVTLDLQVWRRNDADAWLELATDFWGVWPLDFPPKDPKGHLQDAPLRRTIVLVNE